MPTDAEVTRQLNILRDGLRDLNAAILKLENNETIVDTDAILRRLSVVCIKAEEVLVKAKKNAGAAQWPTTPVLEIG
jgi:hypothetical protein